MTDVILDAIETRITELKDELDHLKHTREAYTTRNHSDDLKLSGKELGDLICEWFLSKDRPDAVFNNSEAANGIGMQSKYAARGIRSLLELKVIKDTTPSKSKNKLYGLTAKGAAFLFPDRPKTEPAHTPEASQEEPKAPPRPRKPSPRKAKQKPKGGREKQLLDFLTSNKSFTMKSLTKALGVTPGNAQQILSATRAKHPNLVRKEQVNAKAPATYYSNIYKGTNPPSSPSPASTTAVDEKREAKVTPGEGVEPGRLRGPYNKRTRI